MRWFRNQKTVTKLMLGFGLMAVLLCVLGLEGVRDLISVNTVTRDLYEHHALGLSHLKEGNTELVMASRSLRNALLAKNSAERDRELDQLAKDRSTFSSEYEEFSKAIVSDNVRAKAAVASRAYQQVNGEQDKLVELIRAGQHDRALASLEALNVSAAQLDNAIRDLQASKMQAMKQSADQVESTAHSAVTASVVMMLVAVVLAIVLGLVIARTIVKPLGQMVEAARKLAAGEVQQEIEYQARDEVGKLAESFSVLIETMKGLIGETGKVVDAVRQGQISNRGSAEKFRGAFGELVRGINDALDAFSAPVQEASAVLAKIAERNLTARVTGDYKGDFAVIKNSLNTAAENLGGALTEVKGAAEHVADTAQAIATASEEIASGAQEQASSLEETSSSLEEMTSTVKQNADNAKQASQLAAGSREAAEKGGQVVNAAVAAMGDINQASKRIADIITTIDEIAFQTNLLALNAAVEAARAGEQGRGFAVVASEVRNLAQRSATAAKEIKGLIQDSVKKVESGSDLVNRSGATLNEILQSVRRVTDIVAEIAAASQEQATGIEQVNKAAMQMDKVTQANSAQTEEMSSTAQGLSSSAEELQAMVSRFHLGDGRTAHKSVKTAAGKPERKPAQHSPTLSLAGLAKSTADQEGAFEEF